MLVNRMLVLVMFEMNFLGLKLVMKFVDFGLSEMIMLVVWV